jgi:hypothetical protein
MLRYSLKKSTSALLMAFALLFLAPQIKADTLTVAITDGAFIQNADSTQGRLLLKLDLPTELSAAEIVFAELLVPLTAVIPDSSLLAVECDPLLINWNSATVAWDDLGDSLSGDKVSEQGTRYATSTEGSQETYFNITDITRAWQDSSVANNGLILYYDPANPPYFTYSRGEGAPFATIRFDYSH